MFHFLETILKSHWIGLPLEVFSEKSVGSTRPNKPKKSKKKKKANNSCRGSGVVTREFRRCHHFFPLCKDAKGPHPFPGGWLALTEERRKKGKGSVNRKAIRARFLLYLSPSLWQSPSLFFHCAHFGAAVVSPGPAIVAAFVGPARPGGSVISDFLMRWSFNGIS